MTPDIRYNKLRSSRFRLVFEINGASLVVKRRSRRVSNVKSNLGVPFQKAQRRWLLRVSLPKGFLNLDSHECAGMRRAFYSSAFQYLGTCSFPSPAAARKAFLKAFKLTRCRDPFYIERDCLGNIVGRVSVFDHASESNIPAFRGSALDVLKDADRTITRSMFVHSAAAFVAGTLSKFSTGIFSRVVGRVCAKVESDRRFRLRIFRKRMVKRWKWKFVPAGQTISRNHFLAFGKHSLSECASSLVHTERHGGALEPSLGLLSSRCLVCRNEIAFGLVRNTNVHIGVCAVAAANLKDVILSLTLLLPADMDKAVKHDLISRAIAPLVREHRSLCAGGSKLRKAVFFGSYYGGLFVSELAKFPGELWSAMSIVPPDPMLKFRQGLD